MTAQDLLDGQTKHRLTVEEFLCRANTRRDSCGYDGELDVPFRAPLHAATIEGLTVESAGRGRLGFCRLMI